MEAHSTLALKTMDGITVSGVQVRFRVNWRNMFRAWHSRGIVQRTDPEFVPVSLQG